MKLRDYLQQIVDEVFETRIEQSKIRQDLNYHIMRTDLLEKQVRPLTKIYHWLQVTGAVLVLVGTVLSALKLMGVI